MASTFVGAISTAGDSGRARSGSSPSNTVLAATRSSSYVLAPPFSGLRDVATLSSGGWNNCLTTTAGTAR
jgi:hypothetical protein